MYTSRSAVECYQDCPRYRYNQYLLNGTGVVAVAKSIPLLTGGSIHRGIEYMMNRIRINQDIDVDVAVTVAVREYVAECEKERFRFTGRGTDTDKQQWFTFNEQKALIEALIRVWAIVEAPNIIERYTVVAVERDIEPLLLAPGVLFQAKVDAELQEKDTGAFHNYSLKSVKSWDSRSENSYKSDLQGVTEIWVVEQDAARRNKTIANILNEFQEVNSSFPFPQKNLQAMSDYLKKLTLDKQVSAVRFCILIKGARYASAYAEDTDLHITHSPLIRGYKYLSPGGIAYAHSYKYPNPANKSGFGMLGKGWDAFNVWDEMGVKEWINMLASGEVQAECGDILKSQVFSPVEYFRSEQEIEVAIKEVRYQEARIQWAATGLDKNPEYLEMHFPHVRKHCEFHFGGPCEYKALCWQPEVEVDPVGSGLYQIRMPHHEAERNRG